MAGLTKREENNVKTLSCLDLGSYTKNQTIEHGDSCVAAFTESAKNGWLGDVPKALLELRRQPLNSPSGYDNGKTLIQLMAQIANQSADGTKLATQCQDEKQCNRSPITDAEMVASVAPLGKQPTMNANRGIPITHRGSPWIGFMNVIFSPEIYTPGDTATNEDINKLAQDIRRNVTNAQVDAVASACSAGTFADVPACGLAGAQKGALLLSDNPGIRYEGTKFIGPGNVASNAPATASPALVKKP